MKMNRIINIVLIISLLTLSINIGYQIFGNGDKSNYRLIYFCSGFTSLAALYYFKLVRARRQRNNLDNTN
jgi:hypothetical protein